MQTSFLFGETELYVTVERFSAELPSGDNLRTYMQVIKYKTIKERRFKSICRLFVATKQIESLFY
jgi:hypothetical protein